MKFRVNIKHILAYIFGKYLYRRGLDRPNDKAVISAREGYNKRGFNFTLDGSLKSLGVRAIIRLISHLWNDPSRANLPRPSIELSLVFDNFIAPKEYSIKDAQELSDLVLFDIVETPFEVVNEELDFLNALKREQYLRELEKHCKELEIENEKLKSND